MITIDLEWNGGSNSLNVEENESDFYEAVAKVITTLTPPNVVSVYTANGNAEYSLIKKSGTMFIKENYNYIPLSKSLYKTRYLTCVNPEHNNYKFYKIEQQGTNILVTYGRIGADKNDLYGERTYAYPCNMFWIKYYEKINKGYIDQSDIFLSPSTYAPKTNLSTSSKYSDGPDSAARRLYALLKGHAKMVIEKTCVSSVITKNMYTEAKKNLAKMYQAKTLNNFNDKLLKILTVCPRRVSSVAGLMAHSKDDFPKILQREEDLIAAMEAMIMDEDGVIEQKSKSVSSSNKPSSEFDELGVEVYFANDKQKDQVMNLLNDSLKSQVKNVYRVINKAHQKRFDEYLKKNHIKKVKQLWHGSRNENWFSIINSGLQLHPNAIITGKMFGDGIYFAPSSMKSWGYTSARNAHWVHGDQDIVFMGVYATAYGKPLDCYRAHRYTKTELDREGKNCVHVHAGVQLYNDEIIFYDEAAMVLNYIVEFAA